MRKLGQKGIAPIAAVVAVIAVAGAATGTSIAVDEIDTNPNSPLYSLERAGEAIKEATYAGGTSWNLQRAKERTGEYRAVAKNKVPNDHLNLLEDAGNRISKAVKGIDSGKELKKVKRTLKSHKQVLNEIRRETPDEVNATISYAISNADRMKTVLDDIEPLEIREKGGIPDQAVEKLKQIRQRTREMKSLVKQAEKGGIPDRQAVRRIELQTAEALATGLTEAAEKGELDKRANLVDDVQDHLDAATRVSGDNTALRKAIQETEGHLKILENVKQNVPEPAKKAIQTAVEQSVRSLQRLRRRAEEGPRAEPENVPDNAQGRIEALRRQLRNAVRNYQRGRERIQRRIENVEQWYEKKTEQLKQRYENHSERWQKNLERTREHWKENLERLKERRKKVTENFHQRRDRIMVRFRERKNEILENLEQGRGIGFLDNFEIGPSKIFDNFHSGEKGSGGKGPKGKNPGQIGPPGEILDKLKGKIRQKLENQLEQTRQRIHNRMQMRRNIIENRIEQWRDNCRRISENLDNQLKKFRRIRQRRIQNIENAREIIRRTYRYRIRTILGRLENLLPEDLTPEEILENVLENRKLPEEMLEPGPKGNCMPFVHRRGNPPWAGPPEFAPENEKEWDNISFEIPENEEKIENEAGAYQLMGPELPDHPVSYSINPANEEGVDKSTAITEIKVAFETWDDHTSKELFSDEMSTTTKNGFEQDGTNTVSFAPLDQGVAAKTRVWYSNGTITEFDTVFNSKVEYGVDPDGEGPQTIDEFDLQAMATHEAGHAVGLMDLEDSDYSEMIMYYSSDPGSTIKISLESGDIAGLHELYGE